MHTCFSLLLLLPFPHGNTFAENNQNLPFGSENGDKYRKARETFNV